MKQLKKGKPIVVCDKCGRMINNIKPKYKKVGEIEYRYMSCKRCGAVYVAYATDEALRQNIAKYEEYVNSFKDKPMAQEEMQKAQLLLKANVERSRELKEKYPLVLRPWER
jgi:NAD-dependent SIR2 family protein deacetylase